MSTLQENFEQALLSRAAYALKLSAYDATKTTEAVYKESYIDSLVLTGMSIIQAEEFAKTYKVIDQFTDPDSGFSGTIFEKDGEKFIAIRGSEGIPFPTSTDWQTNFADIGADGIAIEQGIAMFNWLQRIYSTDGQNFDQYQYQYHKEVTASVPGSPLGILVTPAWIERTTINATSSGVLSGYTTRMSVAGHSLGGHLAIMLSRLAPDKIDSVFTYNAPGFDSLAMQQFALTSDGFFNLLQDAAGSQSTVIGSNWVPDIIENFVVESDLVHDIGSIPGVQNTIYSEGNNDGISDSHDIRNIVDSLAVATLFSAISSDIQINTISTIFEASSNQNWNTLEEVVEALHTLFVNPSESIDIEYQDKESLYQYINDIKGHANYQLFETGPQLNTITFHDISTYAPGATVVYAEGDIAYRYALKNLNPFVILGNDILYNQHNQNGELDLYDPVLRTGSMTNEYLGNRCQRPIISNID